MYKQTESMHWLVNRNLKFKCTAQRLNLIQYALFAQGTSTLRDFQLGCNGTVMMETKEIFNVNWYLIIGKQNLSINPRGLLHQMKSDFHQAV